MGVVYLLGLITLANCAFGLVTGRMYYFFKAPDEFLGSVRSISRTETPIFFGIFFAVTAAFGAYVIHFAHSAS